MIEIVSFVRYSNASVKLDSYFFLGVIIFLLICGIFIFQNLIWEEEDYANNKKWIKWKEKAIKENKSDLSNLYPGTKN